MKLALKVVATLFLGAVGGAVLSPLRYQFTPANSGEVSVLYRIDRLTGRAWISVTGNEWRRIQERSAAVALQP